MAAPLRVAAALSLAVLSRGARKLTSSLAQLATDAALPCELKVKYGKSNDEGELVDSITFWAECTEAVKDCWLDQPYQDDKHPGEVVSIKMDGKGADKDLMEIGHNKLRTLRLVSDLFPRDTYVGKTFTLRATKADGEKGETSVTILEPSEAKRLEAEKLAASGALPCTLEAKSVPLDPAGEGFKITLTCDEEVKGLVFTPPKPYPVKRYGSMKPGGTYKLTIVDASKLKGFDFHLTGKTLEGDEELATSVTVTVVATTTQEEVTTTTTTEPEAKPEVVKEPSKAGESPCTITKAEFEDEESNDPAFSITLECSEAVKGELQVGSQAYEFGDHTFEKGKGTEILSVKKEGLEGTVIWFEGTKAADGESFKSNTVTV